MILALVGLFLVALILCGGLLALAVQSVRQAITERDEVSDTPGPGDGASSVSPASSDVGGT